MNRVILILAGCVLTAPVSAQGRADERMRELLAPRGLNGGRFDAPQGPSRFVPLSLPLPGALLPKADAPPRALPKPSAKPIQPRPASEDVPLVRSFASPEPPQPLTLPAHPPVRLWSRDSEAPLPLPILAAAGRDRASLDDPTLGASVAAAQAQVNAGRSQPVPFEPHNLPNPFEHAEAMRLRQPVAESPMPSLMLKPLTP